MAVDVAKYYEGLLTQAGVPEDKRQALLGLLADETVSKALADESIAPRLRHDEFSRKMDALKKEEAEWSDFYKKTLAAHEQNQKVVADYETRLSAYEAGQGADPGAKPLTVATPAGITKEQFDAEIQKRDGNYLTLLKTGLKLVAQHQHEFHEPLDIDSLEKTAIERNITIQQAYDDTVRPKREAATKAAHEADITARVAEGVREFASKNRIPVDTKPREYHMILDQNSEKQVPYDPIRDKGQLTPQAKHQLSQNFVDAYNSTQANTSGGTP